MRKLIGLCFLTATLAASSAHAQSIFIDKGDPSTMSVTLGGQYGGLYGGTLNIGYSYRGVFDVGLDASGSHFTAGDTKNLNGLNLMPFLNWHAFRSDVDEMPISISFLIGISKALYVGNTVDRVSGQEYASPNGWGGIAGLTIYRRIEIGTSMALIPEAVVAYDLTYTRYYTNALDQNAPTVGDTMAVNGYRGVAKHSARGIGRVNMAFTAGTHVLTITPYGGYQGAMGALVGLSLGYVL
jgi:hypothetical protein